MKDFANRAGNHMYPSTSPTTLPYIKISHRWSGVLRRILNTPPSDDSQEPPQEEKESRLSVMKSLNKGKASGGHNASESFMEGGDWNKGHPKSLIEDWAAFWDRKDKGSLRVQELIRPSLEYSPMLDEQYNVLMTTRDEQQPGFWNELSCCDKLPNSG